MDLEDFDDDITEKVFSDNSSYVFDSKAYDNNLEVKGQKYFEAGRISDALNVWSSIYTNNDQLLLKYIKGLMQLKQQETLNKVKKDLIKTGGREDIINYITAVDLWKNCNQRLKAFNLLKPIKFQDAIDRKEELLKEIISIKDNIAQLDKNKDLTNDTSKTLLCKLYYELRDEASISKAIDLLSSIDEKQPQDNKYLGLFNKELNPQDDSDANFNWTNALPDEIDNKSISTDLDLHYLIALNDFQKNEKNSELELPNLQKIISSKMKYNKAYLLRGDIYMKKKEWNSALKDYAEYSLRTGIINQELNKKKKYCIERIKINSMSLGTKQITDNYTAEQKIPSNSHRFVKNNLDNIQKHNFPSSCILKYHRIEDNKVTMDKIEGELLYAKLHTQKHKFGFMDKKQIVLQICSGLQILEEKNFFHPNLNSYCIQFKENNVLIIIDYLIENHSFEVLNWVNPCKDNETQKHIYPFKLIIWELFTESIPFEDIMLNSKYKSKEKLLNKIKNSPPLLLSNEFSPELQNIFLIKESTLTLAIIEDFITKADETKNPMYLTKNECCQNENVFKNEFKKTEKKNSENILFREKCITIGSWEMWAFVSSCDVDCDLYSYVMSPRFVPNTELKINMITQIISGIIDIQTFNWAIQVIDPKYIALKKPKEDDQSEIILKIGNYGVTLEYIEEQKKLNKMNLESSLIQICFLICCPTDVKDNSMINPKEFIKNNSSRIPNVIKDIIESHLLTSDCNFKDILDKLSEQ